MSFRTAVLVTVAVGCLAVPASAVSIVNGTFDTDLTGWTADGPVSAAGGVAVLEENPAGLLTTLSQQFLIPADAMLLRFDLEVIWQSTMGFPVPDAFEVALIDPTTSMSLLDPIVGLPGTDAFLNIQQNGETYVSPGVTVPGLAASGDVLPLAGPFTVRASLTSIPPGTPALLRFDLISTDTVLESQVTVDNVDVALIPEPITAAGIAAAVLGIGGYLRRRRRLPAR